ncbi:hypothetical protein BASA81_001619 [Batrachochytrium salamandrivorans]|nr:hypothetical protein BASA81_001619 [Batrachochytrium salamandrivorans]
MAAKLVQDSFDEAWEETLGRDELDAEIWLEYALDKLRREQEKSSVCAVFERALFVLPGSYKLWHEYLKLRVEWIPLPLTHNQFVVGLNATFQRGLRPMRRYPQIWLLYLDFLAKQGKVGPVRLAFDDCLRALPITQHRLIWPKYESWVFAEPKVPFLVGKSVLIRAGAFSGSNSALVRYLKQSQRYEEAIAELLRHQPVIVRDVLELCEASPEVCQSRLEDIYLLIKQGEGDMDTLQRWGEVLIRLGEFDFAREVFDYALFEVCDSLVHFTRMFESLAQFEQSLLEEGEGAAGQFQLKRLNRLLDDRTERVVGKLFLTKWPGDVRERIALAEYYRMRGDINKQRDVILSVYTEPKADPDLYNGNGADLFKYLGELELGTKLVTKPKELIALWTLRVEQALNKEDGEGSKLLALKLAKESLVNPKCQRSAELWALYLDLETSFGTLATTRAAYESAIELKTISLLGVLNYCDLLQQVGQLPHLGKGKRLEAYLHWGKQSELFFGSQSVRPIFDQAMRDAELNDEQVVAVCIHFSHAEQRLGELDRARAIYKHGAFFQDPALHQSLWDAWNSFEVLFGNEDTFREMLRVKRTVQVHYSALHASQPPPVDIIAAAAVGEVADEELAGNNPEEIDLTE